MLTTKRFNKRLTAATVAAALVVGGGIAGAAARNGTPTSVGGSPNAKAKCQASGVGIGTVSEVRGAFPSTAGRVAAWQERWTARDGHPGPSQWRAHAADEQVTVCFFDGDFPTPRPPEMRPDKGMAERYVTIVGADGAAVPFVAGFKDTVPVESPDA